METIFQVVALYGLVFFTIQRRVFDFVSASFIGQLIYFMPGFYGYVANPYFTYIDPSIPIHPLVYGIWSFALTATIITGFVYRPQAPAWRPITTSAAFDLILNAVIILAFLAELYFSGGAFLSPDKVEVLESATRFSLLFSAATQIGLIAFVLQRKYIALIVPGISVIILLYVGFRTDLALAMIAIATYMARQRGIWIFAKLRYVVPLAAIVLLLFTYKTFLFSYRFGRWDLFYQSLGNEDLIAQSLIRSEPFITQSILNEVVIRELTIPATSMLLSLLAAIPFFVPLVGLENARVAFNFHDQLFPNVSYGLASNIYAHFYAALGIFGIVLFVCLHNFALVGVSKAMSTTRSSVLRVGLLAVGAFLAFYIHRNDLANSLSIINRIVIALAIIWLLGRYLEWPMRTQSGPAARRPMRN